MVIHCAIAFSLCVCLRSSNLIVLITKKFNLIVLVTKANYLSTCGSFSVVKFADFDQNLAVLVWLLKQGWSS